MPSASAASTQPVPLDLTQNLLDVSVTEAGQFRTCRRRWYLETICNLEPKQPGLFMDFGTGLHEALEEHYFNNGDVHDALDLWHKGMVEKLDRDEQPPEIHDELWELTGLGHNMLDNYFEYDQTTKVQLGKILAVEGKWLGKQPPVRVPPGYPRGAKVTLHESGRLIVPIVNPITKQPDELDNGATPCLSARIDLLAERASPKKGLWVIDHKSSGSAPNDRGWDFDDQGTGYCYAVWRWTGKIPRGIVANFLIRNEPKPPRYVQSKKKGEDMVLSTAKDQLTTPDLYRAALIEEGLYVNGTVRSEKHAACLNALLERGWDPFFQRVEVMRNAAELEAYEERLFFQYEDMLRALNDTQSRYPNLSRQWCPNCRVNRICHAIEDGSDSEDIIDNLYRVGEDRKA